MRGESPFATVLQFDIPHPFVEKTKGVQRLILGGGRNVMVRHQVVQEVADGARPHRTRVARPVKPDDAHHPADVRLLRVVAVLQAAAGCTNPVEQCGRSGGYGKRGVDISCSSFEPIVRLVCTGFSFLPDARE